MCGIAGVLATGDCREVIERMTSALVHRGPDDEGFALLTTSHGEMRGMFGHRRLSILDLSRAGHQPMLSGDGRLCLSYNGEIYNFRELRDELKKGGATFRSSGDTEVLLVGWAQWGSGLLSRLRGMFAFSLWDREEERCYLARDAFGIKPLYLHESNNSILFASEVRALLASGRIPRTIDPAALHAYLATGSVAEPLTIINGVEAIPAGTFVTIDCRRGANVVREPIRFAEPLPYPDGSGDAANSHFSDLRSVLRDSVAHHLVSDVPIALFLSGGLDSSSVVAAASEVSETKLDTFTITFGETEYSEAAPARAIAQKFGTTHHEIPLSGKDLLRSLPDSFAAMDQPSLDGLNTYAVSRAVRENGIKVVLSGLGGDELFGGYPSFRRAILAARIWKVRGLARLILSRASSVMHDSRLERVRSLLEAESPARGAYVASRTLFDDTQVRSLISAGSIPRMPPLFQGSVNESLLTLLQQVSQFEITGYMRNTLLRDSDVFSMSHGLELRVPFVDREVARVAMGFPDSQKLRRGMSKPILVETMKDVLPKSLLSRPKQGFTLPFEKWMRQDLLQEIDSTLTSRDLSRVGLSAEAVQRVWSAFQHGKRTTTWSRPWALYTLKRWADQNDVSIDGRWVTPAAAESFAATP